MSETQATLDVLRDIEDYSQHVVVWSQIDSCFEHRSLTYEESEERDDWAVRPPNGELVRFRRKNPNATFDDTLKHFYRDDKVAQMAALPHQLFALIRKDDNVPPDRAYVVGVDAGFIKNIGGDS